MIEEKVLTEAKAIIDQLRPKYNSNRYQFDIIVIPLIQGKLKKKLRQAIIYQITGEERPLEKCGNFAVTNALFNSFIQLQLF